FSSRRRHTRLQGDWSSDVCSSDLGLVVTEEDLGPGGAGEDTRPQLAVLGKDRLAVHVQRGKVFPRAPGPGVAKPDGGQQVDGRRSEERRVGKEGRLRW